MADPKAPSTPFETPYPSYDVLDKWNSPSFDDVTRRVLAHRLDSVPPRRFFSEAEFALLHLIMETVLPQTERRSEDRVPIENFVDEKLFDNLTDGTRYADVLPQREAWRRGLRAVDIEARTETGKGFGELDPEERYAMMARIDTGHVDADAEHWKGLSPKRFFRHVLLAQAVKIYYAHPLAWNEIGFGGPAAPRGYVRLGPDMRDPWEAEEERTPQKAEKLP